MEGRRDFAGIWSVLVAMNSGDTSEGELGDAVFFFQLAPLIAALLCYLFFPQVNAVFLHVSSGGSEYAEIVIRIENVIRMAPLFCMLFFFCWWGEALSSSKVTGAV